ncbi:MAG: acyltransferase family protein [Armatimonadetes bacterium]|nr:acyltransferase family protein [Armatimonadota bacterium]
MATPSQEPKASIAWLDSARIVALFAVVVIHASAPVMEDHAIGSMAWWFANAWDALSRWCVPVLVMISGALLLDPSKQESLSTFYGKRMSRILVPTLFWSAFYLGWTALRERAKGHPVSPQELLGSLLDGAPYYHMWFMFMLVFLYLFTPYLRKVVAGCSRSELSILTAVLFVYAAGVQGYREYNQIGSGPFPLWFLSYLPYFLMGYLVRTDKRKPSKAMLAAAWLLFCCATAGGYFAVLSQRGQTNYDYFYGYFSVTVIPCSIAMMYLLKDWTLPGRAANFAKSTAGLTFGVYLIHAAILGVIGQSPLSPSRFLAGASIPLASAGAFLLALVMAIGISKVPVLRRTI